MPIIISIVSPNGSLLAIRVGAEGSSILAERFEDEGLHAPFRIMLVDQSNKAIKLTINADDSSARKLDGSAFRPM